MEWIADIVVWLLGVFLAVQLIAACYTWIDFASRPKRVFTSLRRIGGWLLVVAIIYVVLPQSLEAKLVYGALFMLGIHILLMFVPNLLFASFRRQQEKDYQAFLRALD